MDAETLKAHKADGTPQRLRGLVMDDRGIRQGYDVVDASGQVVGTVTSGTMSPSLGHGIGMAYLDRLCPLGHGLVRPNPKQKGGLPRGEVSLFDLLNLTPTTS